MMTSSMSMFRGLDIVRKLFGAMYDIAGIEHPEYEQLDRLDYAKAAYETLIFLWGLSNEQVRRLLTCYRAYCRYCLKFYREPSADTYSQMAEFIKAG